MTVRKRPLRGVCRLPSFLEGVAWLTPVLVEPEVGAVHLEKSCGLRGILANFEQGKERIEFEIIVVLFIY